MEVRNRFKGLDLIDRVPDELWTGVPDIVQETGIKTIPMEKCQEPARDIPLVTKVMRKEAQHTQRRDRASGVPPDILEHLPPKTRVCLLYCFVLSPLTLLGAVPHHHLALSVKELTYSSN